MVIAATAQVWGENQAAKGEWIKLIDDDDYIMPECIEIIGKSLV